MIEGRKKPVPPDPDGENPRRALCGNAAVERYIDVSHAPTSGVLKKLLTDLMHWSDYENVDFMVNLTEAFQCYAHQTEERVKPAIEHKLVVGDMAHVADLVNWMEVHENEDDWPLMTEAACNWLGALELGTHVVPKEFVGAIEHAIEDWVECLETTEEREAFSIMMFEGTA